MLANRDWVSLDLSSNELFIFNNKNYLICKTHALALFGEGVLGDKVVGAQRLPALAQQRVVTACGSHA